MLKMVPWFIMTAKRMLWRVKVEGSCVVPFVREWCRVLLLPFLCSA